MFLSIISHSEYIENNKYNNKQKLSICIIRKSCNIYKKNIIENVIEIRVFGLQKKEYFVTIQILGARVTSKRKRRN